MLSCDPIAIYEINRVLWRSQKVRQSSRDIEMVGIVISGRKDQVRLLLLRVFEHSLIEMQSVPDSIFVSPVCDPVWHSHLSYAMTITLDTAMAVVFAQQHFDRVEGFAFYGQLE